MIPTTPPPISPPLSPLPTRTIPTKNDSVTTNSPSPSLSGSCALSERNQAIINAHRDGKLSSLEWVKFSDVGIREWQDTMALSHSDQKLSALTDVVKIFAADTKKNGCRDLTLTTKRGSAILKLGEPDIQLHCTRLGYAATEETSHSGITTGLTQKILQFLYEPHETSGIGEPNAGNSPLPDSVAAPNWPETKPILVKELPAEVKPAELDDGIDSDTISVNSDDDGENFPPPPTLEELNGGIRLSEGMVDSNAVASQTEDEDKFNVSARSPDGLNAPQAVVPKAEAGNASKITLIMYDLEVRKKSAQSEEAIHRRQSSSFSEVAMRRGITPVASPVTQLKERQPAANQPNFDGPQSECSSLSSMPLDSLASPTSSVTSPNSLARGLSYSEKLATMVNSEAEQRAVVIAEFNAMVNDVLNGRTKEAVTKELEKEIKTLVGIQEIVMAELKQERAKSQGIHSELDDVSTYYQQKIKLLMETQSNLRTLMIGAINSDEKDSTNIFLIKEILRLARNNKNGKNTLLGTDEIKQEIKTLFLKNQAVIDAGRFQVLNPEGSLSRINVSGTARRYSERDEEIVKSRSPSPKDPSQG